MVYAFAALDADLTFHGAESLSAVFGGGKDRMNSEERVNKWAD